MKNKENLIDLINETFKELNKQNIEFNKEEKIKEELMVSELQMHKILYFLFGYFWKEFELELFEPHFQAWKYGPVEINYRKDKKIDNYYAKMTKRQLTFLKDKIEKLLNYGIWYLVQESHLTNPWIDNYNSNGDWKDIPNDQIKEYFGN